MRAACLVSVVLVLVAPRAARGAEGSEARSPRASIGLRAGPYWTIDRDERTYDGPSAALSGELAFGRAVGAVLEVGAAGELAGGRGTCLAELSVRTGPSLSLAPGPDWLRFVLRGGPGLVWARLYGSLLGATTPTMTAYGDRLLPELWSSAGAEARLGRWSLTTDLFAMWMPSATFHADHVPDGAMPEFYPTFRRAHDLSTYGVTGGLALRF